MTGAGTQFLLEHKSDNPSPLQGISATAQLISLLAVLISLVSFGKYEVLRLLPFGVYPIIMISAGKLSPGPVFRIYLTVLPLFFCFFLSSLIFGKETLLLFDRYRVRGGFVSGSALLVKGTLTILSVLSLVSLKGFTGLLGAMKKLRIPEFFILVLAMMVRYISIMVEEAVIITRAYQLRAPARKGVYWRDWGPMGGQWFIRTFRRGERIRCAMDLRGGDSEHTNAGYTEKIGKKDLLWTVSWIGFCFLFCGLSPLYRGGAL